MRSTGCRRRICARYSTIRSGRSVLRSLTYSPWTMTSSVRTSRSGRTAERPSSLSSGARPAATSMASVGGRTASRPARSSSATAFMASSNRGPRGSPSRPSIEPPIDVPRPSRTGVGHGRTVTALLAVRSEAVSWRGRDWRSGGSPPGSGGVVVHGSSAWARWSAVLRRTERTPGDRMLDQTPRPAHERTPSQAVTLAPLSEVDPELAAVLTGELGRQRGTLEMIASENFAPRAVLEAQGSVLTNKYAEGYPGKRYYGGCEFVDIAEDLARDRVKALFGAAYANVQPHSGAQANAAAMAALLTPGDRILGLELAHGGHLTHGMRLNFSGKLYSVSAYGVDSQTMRVDMDAVRAKALEDRPQLIIAGWSAYSRQLDFAAFRRIADEAEALLL